MKWGKYLQENMITEWKQYYVQYKSLKKFISMSELNQGDMDEQFFIQKVETQVREIETWFLHVKRECLESLEKVKQELPDNIKANLPCLEGYTSFPVSARSMKSEIMAQFKRAKVDSALIPNLGTSSQSDLERAQDDEMDPMDDAHLYDADRSHRLQSSKNNNNNLKNNTLVALNVGVIEEEEPRPQQGQIASDASKNSEMTPAEAEETLDAEDERKEQMTLLSDELDEPDLRGMRGMQGMQGVDESDDEVDDLEEFDIFGGDDGNNSGMGMKAAKSGYYQETTPTRTRTRTFTNRTQDSVVTTSLRVMSEREKRMERDFVEDFAKVDQHGYRTIKPPISVYNDYRLFSHLPISSHSQCLIILRTLGKLKIFGWQNSEGLRKIIKKFDKRFGRSLTQTLWPKIKLSEFVQEIKTDSYIAQVAAVLCTRTIPCDTFDANELREQGVNLRQMATAIQQLANVVDRNLPEVIPMNVEPRSYMANERTWLKWMRMAAFTTLVGMILIGMGHEPVTGMILVLLSIAVMGRSYFEYVMRNRCLVARKEHEWIDHIGPKLMMLSFLLPCITYITYVIYFKDERVIFHK